MFKHFFKEYLPLQEAMYNDQYAIYLNIIGGLLIAVPFLIIGIICIYYAGKGEASIRRKILTTKLFGFFLVSCALARVIDVLCIWHQYAIINGYVKILTGLIALFAIFLIPSVIREGMHSGKISDIKNGLERTNQSLDELKQITEKISNDPTTTSS